MTQVVKGMTQNWSSYSPSQIVCIKNDRGILRLGGLSSVTYYSLIHPPIFTHAHIRQEDDLDWGRR